MNEPIVGSPFTPTWNQQSSSPKRKITPSLESLTPKKSIILSPGVLSDRSVVRISHAPSRQLFPTEEVEIGKSIYLFESQLQITDSLSLLEKISALETSHASQDPFESTKTDIDIAPSRHIILPSISDRIRQLLTRKMPDCCTEFSPARRW